MAHAALGIDKQSFGVPDKLGRLHIPENVQVRVSGFWIQNMDGRQVNQMQERVHQLHEIFKNMTGYDKATRADLEAGETTRIMLFPIKAVDATLQETVQLHERSYDVPKDPTIGNWKHDHTGMAICFYAENAGPEGQPGLLHALLIMDQQSARNALDEIRTNPGYLFTLLKQANQGIEIQAADKRNVAIVPGKKIIILPTSTQPYIPRSAEKIDASAEFPPGYKVYDNTKRPPAEKESDK